MQTRLFVLLALVCCLSMACASSPEARRAEAAARMEASDELMSDPFAESGEEKTETAAKSGDE